MGGDFRASPIAIRLSCRYSNGTVVSYVGRALHLDDSQLRVLSAETFESGVQLSVLAPFWDGISSCRVVEMKECRRKTKRESAGLGIGSGKLSATCKPTLNLLRFQRQRF